ncbi:MAG: YdcF family protein [Chloroflexota bacterium]|nr:YdcF family protein [Chloroflexota bacterium]
MRISLVWMLIALGITLAVLIYGSVDRAQRADVIVILGSGLQSNNRPGPAMIRRVGRGAELWHAGYAPLIICSGGYGLNRTRSEADACAELLRELGVAPEAILLEEHSRSTEENAIFTREIMAARGLSSALIVSDGYHLLRAGWIFSSQGYSFAFSRPETDPPFVNHVQSVAREVVALHWYALKTLLNLPVTYVPILYHTGQFRTFLVL